jgi:sugar/nucleoside kinase (ribokinase family)
MIVMGDLCLDVLIDSSDSTPFAQLGYPAESAVRSSGTLSVGGSAWLLAQAAMATGFFGPVILGAIGNDIWARDLLACLREAGLSIASIQQVGTASTDLVCMITLPGRNRVMFMPTEPTSNRLDEDFARSFLGHTDPKDVKWIFLSGYVLVDRNSTRRRCAKLLADWSRQHGIPVALDLVPHEFRASVGTLHEVAEYLGVPDVLIGMLPTFQELGYIYAGDDNDTAMHMAETAVLASRDWGTIITQAHTRSGVFGQTIAQRGAVLFSSELTIPAHGARGAGDRLAVEALHRLGHLRARRVPGSMASQRSWWVLVSGRRPCPPPADTGTPRSMSTTCAARSGGTFP